MLGLPKKIKTELLQETMGNEPSVKEAVA
jgi:hypothetical protein